MKIGAYHFLSYDTPGASQADNFINTVNKKWGMLPQVVTSNSTAGIEETSGT